MPLTTETVSLNGPFLVKGEMVGKEVKFSYKTGHFGGWNPMPKPRNVMHNAHKPLGNNVQYEGLLRHTVHFIRLKGDKIKVRIMKGNTIVGVFSN